MVATPLLTIRLALQSLTGLTISANVTLRNGLNTLRGQVFIKVGSDCGRALGGLTC